jgi:hypothetical protein
VIDPLIPWMFHLVTPYRLVMINVKSGIALQQFGMQAEAILYREEVANNTLSAREHNLHLEKLRDQLGAQLKHLLQQER